MAAKFFVKDEDLPKPTILSNVHTLSFILQIFGWGKLFPAYDYILIYAVLSIFIQVIYLAVFYKEIVGERYADPTLRASTITFISLNITTAIFTYFGLLTDLYPSPKIFFFTLILVLLLTVAIIIYYRQMNSIPKMKYNFDKVKNFSFPFYKYTVIILMFFFPLLVFLQSKIFTEIFLLFFTLGFIYTGLGSYFHLKKKDELERLIRYEASFIAMQFMPVIFCPLFMFEIIFKVSMPWIYILTTYFILYGLIQAFINKKYE